MSESDEFYDSERERVIRYLKFMGFILILVIGWYAFDLAEGI